MGAALSIPFARIQPPRHGVPTKIYLGFFDALIKNQYVGISVVRGKNQPCEWEIPEPLRLPIDHKVDGGIHSLWRAAPAGQQNCKTKKKNIADWAHKSGIGVCLVFFERIQDRLTVVVAGICNC